MTCEQTVEGVPATGRTPSTGPYVLPIHLLAPTAGLLLLGAYSIFSSIPSTILTLPYLDQIKPNAVSAMPQGWAFFSKSPRDPSVAPYREDASGSLESLSRLPTTRVENLFGVSREGRAQGVEVALISSGSEAGNWMDCSSPVVQECVELLRDAPSIAVTNAVASPTVCGDVVLVQTTPVPWSFRHQTLLRDRADKAVKMRVDCHGR
ncbi:SdpA family antimicrobial peptide system protein [Arthrobacter sp. TS-15]|uniref:SdpA family antimicrobial peptide system protein n=1 Tax=unclassified Arthrobacter TaxID=235627 RepID=UPI00115F5474|nr:SdpA family antimicrobial peptide system protein [Arthrobacter sp. TS-15]